MNEMRKLMEAIKLIEDFDDEEHYSIKDATIERFRGRRIIVTDLYDGDIYGILDKKHGPRFMISAPLWRDEVGPGEVMDDEVSVVSPTFDINKKDEEFLRQWYMGSVNESIKEANQGGKTNDKVRNLESRLSLFRDMASFYARGGIDKGSLARSILKTEEEQQRRSFIGAGNDQARKIDEDTAFSDAGDMVKYMLRELQKVKQNAHKRIREINSEPLLMAESDMVLDHYTETLDQICNLVERMENAYVSTPRK